MRVPMRPDFTRGKTVLATFVLSILILSGMTFGCNSRKESSASVAPGKLFSGPLIDIHAPDSAGWLMGEANTEGMTFIRRDEKTGVTSAAQVLVSRVDPTVDILEVAKTLVGKRSPEPRYRTVETNFELVSERPYPCVRYRGTIQDTGAQTPMGTASLSMVVRSLIFRHPKERNLVFDVTFSQRGGAGGPELESEAESFMKGVQVPQGK